MFSLLWQRGAPRLTLVSPDGRVYDPTHIGPAARPGDPQDFVPYHLTKNLPAGDVAGEAIYIPHPRPGFWRVTVANLTGNEGYQMQARAVTPPPTLAVTAPAAGQTLAAHPSVTLRGTLADRATGTGNNTVALYYTTGPTVRGGGKTMLNYAGTSIANGVPVTNGRWAYTWDTSGLPAGTYSVYAQLNDGVGPTVNGYAAGQVRVTQPARPDAPRDVTATDANGQLALMWSPPAHAAIVRGYRLRWRAASPPYGPSGTVGRYYTLDLGESTSYTLNETQRGARYRADISDYDLSGRQSAWTPASVLRGDMASGMANGRPAGFGLNAGRGATDAGGFVSIPLTLRPATGGRPTHGPGDFVELSVSGPAGVLARPTLSTVNLFAPASGAAAPAIHVFTSATLRPGVYQLGVTARQGAGDRVRGARAVLVVRGGSPSTVMLSAGAPQRRADGMVEQAVLARVLDNSGAPVSDGTATLRFSASDGAFAPARAAVAGGTAHATLVYVAGTRPIVTADAGTTLGRLYLGPTPAGAGRDRFFAATTGRAGAAATRHSPAVAAVSEDIVLRDPLPADASARLLVSVASPTGGKPTTRVLYVPVLAGGTAVAHLNILARDSRPVGVEVRSDLPLVTTRIAGVAAPRGTTRALNVSRGVDSPRAAYRVTLAPGRALINLYNPGPTMRAVTVSVAVAGLCGGATARLRLTPQGVAQLDVDAVIAARARRAAASSAAPTGDRGRARGRASAPAHIHGSITVTVRSDGPIVVDSGL